MPAPRDQPRWPDTIPWRERGPAPGRWRSRIAATAWTDLLHQRIVGIPDWMDRRKVALRALRRPRHIQPIAGGAIAQTERLTYDDGTTLIRKTFSGGEADDRLDQHKASAEYMASLVAQAVGAAAPAVVKDPTDPEHAVLMGEVRGELGEIHTGAANAAEWGQAMPYLAATDGGRRIGLLDVLIGNADRHAMNWMLSTEMTEAPVFGARRDPTGQPIQLRRPIAIDHSEAFPLVTLAQALELKVGRDGKPQYTLPLEVGAYGGFLFEWMERADQVLDRFGDEVENAGIGGGLYGFRERNPLHPDDIPVLRRRLERLHELFMEEPSGHAAYTDMMRRFEQLAAHAAGTSRMFPDEN